MYGERWGRCCLDVAGSPTQNATLTMAEFAVTHFGVAITSSAFNSGKPFDELVREQLASDEIVPLPHKNMTPDVLEKLTATGLLRMAPDKVASGGIDQSVARTKASPTRCRLSPEEIDK